MLEFLWENQQYNENHRIPYENHEKHGNFRINYENHENFKNPRNSREDHENPRNNSEFDMRNTKICKSYNFSLENPENQKK